MKRTILFVAVFYLIFIVPGLLDPSRFILAGDVFTDSNLITVYPGNGYDGQFFYSLAIGDLDHLGLHPAYRHQRILYPLLARVLALGRVQWIPYALILVNYAGLLIIAALGVLLARQSGRPDWYGLLFALWPGFFITLTRDLSEIVAAAFLLAALLLIRRPWLATFLLSLSVLSRETTLLATLALGPFGLLPVAVYAIWQTALRLYWGVWPIAQGGSNFTFAAPILPILALCAPVFLSLRRVRFGLALAWLAYLALTLSLGYSVWRDYNAYLRATTELYVLGILILMKGRNHE